MMFTFIRLFWTKGSKMAVVIPFLAQNGMEDAGLKKLAFSISF